MNHSLIEKIKSFFTEIQVDLREEDRIVLTTKQESAMAVLSFLKDLGFNHLALISCVDWINENKFELVYVLSAYMQEDEQYNPDRDKINIILKTKISRKKPQFLSIIPIFKNAEPYEREIHELFGVHFVGHPRLTPLLLCKEYKIPPFRKDFDTRDYVKNFFEKIPFVQEKAKK